MWSRANCRSRILSDCGAARPLTCNASTIRRLSGPGLLLLMLSFTGATVLNARDARRRCSRHRATRQLYAAGERIGAEVLQREPDFQRPEAVQEFRAEIAWPHFARGKSGFSAGEIGVCRGECLFVCFTILNQQISYVIGRMGPVVKIKPNGIGAINAAS